MAGKLAPSCVMRVTSPLLRLPTALPRANCSTIAAVTGYRLTCLTAGSSMTQPTNFYASRVLDRVSHLREDPDWLAER
ncbi:MAG: hypothetical protein VW644_01265, partial [Alphaproteobacteria bacterium]